MLKLNLASITLSTLVLVSALFSAAPKLAAAQQAKKPAFYCDVSVFTPQERATLHGIGPKLVAAKRTTRELPNGFEIQFMDGAAMYQIVSTWLPLEVRCCPCFDVSVSYSGSGGPVTVRITGAPGIKQFIASELPKLTVVTGAKKSK